MSGDRSSASAGGGRGAPKPAMDVPQVPAGRCWREADGMHIDVRGLPPPQPLVAILALVASCASARGQPRGCADVSANAARCADASPCADAPGPGDSPCVVVHHQRDPVMLYPELAELGWGAERIDAPPGEVRLRLAPQP